MPAYSNRYDEGYSRKSYRKGAVYAPPPESSRTASPEPEPDNTDWQGWQKLCQQEGWLHLVMEEEGWLALKRGNSSFLTLISLEGDGERYDYSLDEEENPGLERHLSCWMNGERYQEKFNRAAKSLFD